MNKYQRNENSDVSHLEYLVSFLGTQSPFGAKEANRLLHSRYSQLERKYSDLLEETQYDADSYYALCLRVHAHMYKDIFDNPGRLRQSSDLDNGGNVYFGINSRTGENRFTGTAPEHIETELSEAFQILFNDDYDCVEASIRFYSEFVAIHPFHDANGRIGRYIMNLYLQYHHHYIDWNSLSRRKGKLLRKLNYCHSVRERYRACLKHINEGSNPHPNSEIYWAAVREKYIGYLLQFWKLYVFKIDAEEE